MASGKYDDDLNEVLTNQLECPVCFFTCASPIYLCSNGHNVCGDCQENLKACPVCRVVGRPSIRNLFAEQVSLNIIAECQNNTQGCSEYLKVREMNHHLKTCGYGYKCMLRSCDWRGSVVALAEHVKAEHADSFLEISDSGARIRIDAEDYEKGEDLFLTNMLSYEGNIFWFHVDISDSSTLDAVVRLIGPEDQKIASTFTYRLQFYSECGSKIVIFFKKVRSLHDDSDEFLDSIFDDTFALTSLSSETHLEFSFNLFTNVLVSNTMPVSVGKMEVRFSYPDSWPDMEYREISRIRDKKA